MPGSPCNTGFNGSIARTRHVGHTKLPDVGTHRGSVSDLKLWPHVQRNVDFPLPAGGGGGHGAASSVR